MRPVTFWLSWAAGAAWLLATVAAVGPGASAQEAKRPAPARKADVKMEKRDGPRIAGGEQNDEAIARQFEQQYGRQIQVLVKSELHLMRLAAKPTKAQFEKISADAEAGRKAVVRKLAPRINRVADDADPDPRAMFADAVAAAAKAHLPPEQAALYRKELDLRAAARKRAAVINLAATIDRLLVLTPEQRGKVEGVLRDNWNDAWNQTQYVMYGSRYLPPMPDEKILPLLTATQKEVWRGHQRGRIRFGFQLHFLNGVEVADEVWDDPPPGGKK